MSESKTVNTLLNTELPPSIDNAVKNLSDKPTASIGTTVSDIWYIVFGWISNIADKKRVKYAHSLEQFREELENSVSKIPPEKRTEPSLQTTAQALENAKYCIEEKELRQMFTSLISNSMNTDFSKDIHPSFAEILKQMAPLDASIIKCFKDSKTNGYPLCRFQYRSEKGYILLLDNVFLQYPNPYLPGNSLAISSLSRLGLLDILYDQWLPTGSYTPFKEHPWYKLLQEKFPDKSVELQMGIVRLTPLGRSFATVCVPD